MSEESIICITCKKEEKDAKKVIECAQCHKCKHFKCRNVLGNAIRKLKEKTYFCSMECQDFYQRATCSSTPESQVMIELRKVLTEIQGTRSEVHDMKNTITEMERFQNFLSNQLDSLLVEVKSLKVEQAALKSGAFEMKKKHQELSNTVSDLEIEVDRLNRMSLSKNAMLLGMPMKKEESVKQIVEKLSTVIGYELPDGAIASAKRLSLNEAKQRNMEPAPIKIVFTSEQFKEEFFLKKRNHGPVLSTSIDPSLSCPARKLMLRDEMTPRGMELYRQVRELQESLNYKYVWPGRNGVILAKRTDTSKPEFIRSQYELQGLQRIGAKRNLDKSSAPDIQSSPVQEPAAKRR